MRARLLIALGVTVGVALLELFAGVYAHSLALLSDAAHVAMDVIALTIALVAYLGSLRPARGRQTYGFGRIEVLGALANATLLSAIAVLIAIEALRRLNSPVLPMGAVMSAAAAVGFVANAAIGWMLARGAHRDLNIRAALYHIASDVLGAFAVVAGGIAILIFRSTWIDPLLALFVSAIILAGAVRLIRDASAVILESAPAGVSTQRVAQTILAIPGVQAVHDLHVWMIGSGSSALSAHVLLSDTRTTPASEMLAAIDRAVRTTFGIAHVTVQFECVACEPGDTIVCTQPLRSREHETLR